MNKKAQVALEFLLYLILGIFIVILFVAIVLNYSQSTIEQQQIDEISDFGKSLQKELLLAAQMEEGYHRRLILPQRLKRTGYGVASDNSTFTLTTPTGLTVTFPTPLLNGTFQKGENYLYYINNTIFIT